MGLITDLRDYRLAFTSPFRNANGVVSHREGVLISVSDGSHSGWGEAAPLPGRSTETLNDCRRVLKPLASRLNECESVNDPRVSAILTELEAWPHARAALVGAVFDLLAKGQGSSVASLLCGLASGFGAKVPQSVAVNGLISHQEPTQVAATAEELTAEGVVAVKLKVAFTDPRTDLARVAAARSAIGDDVELRLDANGGWDVDTAITILHKMTEYNVAFCEEPTSGAAGIATVGSQSAVPVAIDESADTLKDIAAALQTNSISVVVIKPQALGGSDKAMTALSLLEEFGAQGVVTTMIDSAVGVAHAAHLAVAALPHEVHGLHTSSLLADDVGLGLEIRDGRLHLAQHLGLGVSPTR